jgi:prepilin-type N-terminal cleavage/methylation domain-containing protein
MSLNTKKGFTLIELLVGIVVIGIISTVATRMIYNMVSYRSKQFAIEDTSDSFRNFILTFSNEVRGSRSINIISANKVEIDLGDGNCVAYRYQGDPDYTIEMSTDSLSSCTSDPSFSSILQGSIDVGSIAFSPVGNGAVLVQIDISGKYKDSTGDRPFTFKTTVSKRI